jgi:hypothetical protein
VLRGLALWSLPSAFDWVTAERTEKVLAALRAALPLLLEQFGASALEDHLDRLLPGLPEVERTALDRMCKAIGLATQRPVVPREVNRAQSPPARYLDAAGLRGVHDPEARHQQLLAKLQLMSVTDDPAYIQALLCLAVFDGLAREAVQRLLETSRAQTQPIHRDRRTLLASLIDDLVETTTPARPEVVFDLGVCAEILRNGQRDVTQELYYLTTWTGWAGYA